MDYIIRTAAVYALPVIFAICLHEAAHGYIAKMFGDNTAYMQGRVSLNPIRHIDPVGTILVPLALLAVTHQPYVFGWAKPVPVNYGNLRDPKNNMRWVALAGPGANLAMALLWAIFLKLLTAFGVQEQYFIKVAVTGILINLSFMLLNLIPIPPLDGSKVLMSLLPHRAAWTYAKLEPYGMYIILLLLMTQVLSAILTPALTFSFSAILTIFAIQ